MPIVSKNISSWSPDFPKRLLQIPDKPKSIYVRGQPLDDHTPCIAVVGTRKPSSYGVSVTQNITAQLVLAGFTIVSGMAFGIDSLAHRTALKKNGHTIAVLGSSVDDKSIYPRNHFRLAHEIMQQGTLVSEYPENTEVRKFHFPQRNRIISALCLGVIIVECLEKSGALITADHALDQNIPVFTFPGSIYNRYSAGPHELLRNGAVLVRTVQDIIDELPARSLPDSLPTKNVKASGRIYELTPNEQKIIDCLTNQPKYLDLIHRETSFSLSVLLQLVSELEAKKLIINNQGFLSIAL